MDTLNGAGVSPGIGLGPAHVLLAEIPEPPPAPGTTATPRPRRPARTTLWSRSPPTWRRAAPRRAARRRTSWRPRP
ncbi:hypothetical protein [Thermocatellispora tengchongensis]|uniref:hypothetical protein n=1 Tax=Thermocatellispora tengchongensis TaxID=1073253 RepID=UPI003634C425